MIMPNTIIEEYQEALADANRVTTETQQLASDLAYAQSYAQSVNQVDGCLYLEKGELQT